MVVDLGLNDMGFISLHGDYEQRSWHEDIKLGEEDTNGRFRLLSLTKD